MPFAIPDVGPAPAAGVDVAVCIAAEARSLLIISFDPGQTQL